MTKSRTPSNKFNFLRWRRVAPNTQVSALPVRDLDPIDIPSIEVAAPSGLSAVAAGSDQINLSWTDNSSNETGFQIQRSLTAGSGFSIIATVSADVTAFQNTGLTASTTYHYRVRAISDFNNSAFSNEANATTS